MRVEHLKRFNYLVFLMLVTACNGSEIDKESTIVLTKSSVGCAGSNTDKGVTNRKFSLEENSTDNGINNSIKTFIKSSEKIDHAHEARNRLVVGLEIDENTGLLKDMEGRKRYSWRY